MRPKSFGFSFASFQMKINFLLNLGENEITEIKLNQTIICVSFQNEALDGSPNLGWQTFSQLELSPPLVATCQEKLNNRYVPLYGFSLFIDLMFYVKKLLWHDDEEIAILSPSSFF